jgi:gamma-glutamylcyclotransferase (GGCT)/AIG2-like uncharacterized protein YtfP
MARVANTAVIGARPSMSVPNPCLPVFLYGPLRPGSSHPYAVLLASRCRQLGPGRMKGRLFRRGAGFAAIYEPNGAAEIIGEVLELPDAGAEQILDSLDRFEGIGIGTGLPGAPVFVRERIPVELFDCAPLECWVWTYCGPVEDLAPVRNGDALAMLGRGGG